ncbi:uncharacterized protein LOC62_06G007874 [Vanrija pseudolonga]|uniref:Uncharacterized protein n=1 Tax=Vanrija pseudolonga TaxID=143232 RepID=A0AAF0YI31_9TREE|nr:hypothetical protein LOC62_06G007874 [Vanrija pseudolonga]
MSPPRVRDSKAIPRHKKPVATQAEWNKIIDKVNFDAVRKLDGVSIEQAASRIRFKLRPPKVTTWLTVTPSAHPVDENFSKVTQTLYKSEREFRRYYDDACKYCSKIGNKYCFYLPKSPYTECIVCWADGEQCTHGQPLRTPRQVRREAVDKLVAGVKDRGAALKALKEFEAAEEEEKKPKDVDRYQCFRTKKPAGRRV